MDLSEHESLLQEMEIPQDPKADSVNVSMPDNIDAIEYFFRDIEASLPIDFPLFQAKLIIAAISISGRIWQGFFKQYLVTKSLIFSHTLSSLIKNSLDHANFLMY